MNKNLEKIREEILEIIKNKQNDLGLTFEEDTHTYTMKNLNSELSSDWPSVSKVLKHFYTPFPAEEIAERKSNGDPEVKSQLLKEWSDAGEYATNMGSRTHFLLEKKSLEMFGIEKEVRQPIFECDFIQIIKSDSMVSAGTNFLKLMEQRGAILLDTEMILGDNNLGYTGQPDTMWLIFNSTTNEVGIIITDYKTNKPKNFESNQWTKNMLPPFQTLPDNALGHYFIQLPFYCKLLLKMLEGSKYEGIKVFGGIVVLVKENGDFEEFRIPKKTFDTVFEMDMSKYLTK
jgi:hypothetical protein